MSVSYGCVLLLTNMQFSCKHVVGTWAMFEGNICHWCPLYNVLQEGNVVFLHVNYTVYKHFDMSLHVGSSDSTSVQICRPVTLTVFEMSN